MSNGKKLYQESWRFIRLLMQGTTTAIPVIATYHAHLRPFTNALISWDTRLAEYSGWRNHLREYYFNQGINRRQSDDGIPF